MSYYKADWIPPVAWILLVFVVCFALAIMPTTSTLCVDGYTFVKANSSGDVVQLLDGNGNGVRCSVEK